MLALRSGFVEAEQLPQNPDFDRDIRPILSENCFACHGPDSQQRQADLRLDLSEGHSQKRPSGRSILVPGDAEKSLLFERIRSDNKHLRMPPASSGKELTDRQIELIRRWIDGGARYQTHWAFQAPESPHRPAVEDSAWTTNPIDFFVLAQLERKGLAPKAPADRATLIRRLTLDLLGLPPSLEEIDQFLADRSEDAYENLVDRLLKSPHYGERWGRWWLDAARYADSDGF